MPVLPPNPRLSDFLRPFPPRVVHLAMKLREFVLEEAAGATELVYDAYNAVALGYTFNGRPKGSFVHIAVYANHVNLGFNQGTDLPDPRGLLKGSGKCIRHVTVEDESDLTSPYLRSLLRAAIAGADRGGDVLAKSIIKAVSQRERRPSGTRRSQPHAPGSG